MSNKTISHRFAVFALWIALLAGCVPPTHETPTGLARSTDTAPAPSATAQPTPTLMHQSSQTQHVDPTVTSSPLSTTNLTRACIDPNKPSSITLPPGNIVLIAIDNPSRVILMNAETGALDTLPRSSRADVISSVHVAPNSARIVFRNETLDRLMVADSSDSVFLSIPWPLTWQQVDGWLNDHQLIVDVSTTGETHGLITFDVDSQVQRELPGTFPDLSAFDPDPFWQWFNATKVIYDRTATTALYPGQSKGIGTLIQRSIPDDKILRELPGTISYGLTPIWSPDNQHVVIKGPSSLLSADPAEDTQSNQEELYMLDVTGAIERITQLTKNWSEVDFYQYSWSPKATRLAFRFIAGPYNYPDLYPTSRPDLPGRLAVLNLTDKTIMDYCLPSGQSLAAPVWSPDGRYLLVEDYYQSMVPYASTSYVVDLETQSASILIDGFTPIGWVAWK